MRLRLTGNGLAVLVAALHAALEAFCRCGSNRLGDCLVVKEILLGLGEQENMLIAAGASVFHASGMGLSFIQMMSLRRYQPVSRRAKASIHGMPIMSFGLQPSTLLLRATA